jgi:hypothetical protein
MELTERALRDKSNPVEAIIRYPHRRRSILLNAPSTSIVLRRERVSEQRERCPVTRR